MTQIKFTPDLLTGRLSENDAKRYFSRFGWFAVAFCIVLSLSQTVILLLVRGFAPSLIENAVFAEIFSVIPIYAIAFPIALLILAPLPTVRPVKEKLRVRDVLLMFCICEALMSVGNYISMIVISAFQSAMGGAILENPISTAVDENPMWITLIFTVILAPILEELFFRGAVCKKLLILGEGYAVVLSSAFFALCHGNFFQLFYAFTTGCFFGFIYVKTGKLLYTTLCHMGVNLLGTVVVSAITDYVDLEALYSESFALTAENMSGLLVFLIYELLTLAMIAVGFVVLFKNIKRIKFDTGLLPPPKGTAGVSCIFLNFGVAVAIAVFALNFLGSLIM